MLATAYPFKRIIGVEFSAALCQIAKDNLNIFKNKCSFNSAVDIIQVDVTAHKIGADENVFFMFDPFGEEILEQFITALKFSFKIYPRQIWIIYHNPTHRKIIDDSKIFEPKLDQLIGGSHYLVYKAMPWMSIKLMVISKRQKYVTFDCY